jgi:transposase
VTILTVGIDLAKNVFAVHGRNEEGRAELLRPAVPRAKLLALIASLPPCVVAMEACSGAHHWARLFARHGNTVRLIAPKFVTPYRRTGRRGKNDAADAAAICEAATRPDMLFVPVKSEEQQQQLMVHRARQGFIEARTATINRIRGLLSEFGIVLPLKANTVRQQAALHLEALPGHANTVIGDLLSELTRLDERIAQYDVHIRGLARGKDNPAQRADAPGGHRRDDRHGHPRDDRQRPRLQVRPAVCGLDRPGARPVQLGWQDAPGAHHEGR